MLTTNDLARVYDTVLSTPGMTDAVKIDMKLSRKNILLLHYVIKRGLSLKDDDKSNLLSGIPEETIKELDDIADDYLAKAGLNDLSAKLSGLGSGNSAKP